MGSREPARRYGSDVSLVGDPLLGRREGAAGVVIEKRIVELTQQRRKRPTLSERNGDKSRFGRERRKKILQRKRNRELRERLKATTPLAVNSAKHPH